MTYVIVAKSDTTGICFKVDRKLCNNKIWSFSLKVAKLFDKKCHAKVKLNKIIAGGVDCMIVTFEQAKKLREYYQSGEAME